jgi:hypothetical protein
VQQFLDGTSSVEGQQGGPGTLRMKNQRTPSLSGDRPSGGAR